ncbi:MAG: chitobiase/beta-hexosaminidase C-terminal domain-containing protein, partial [Phycisphaerales bacterium]
MNRLLCVMAVMAGSGLSVHAQTITSIELNDVPLQLGGPPIALDLDANGTNESFLRFGDSCGCGDDGVVLESTGQVQFLVGQGFGADALALAPASEVSARSSGWLEYAWLVYECCFSGQYGEWNVPRTSFIGYRITGTPERYGWIRVSSIDGWIGGIVLHDAAFENTGGLILTGEDRFTTIAPRMEPPGGAFTDVQTVTISTPTADAEIRYTLDGSIPGPSSPIIANGGTIQVLQTGTVVRASASSPNLSPSFVSASSYRLVCATPEPDPDRGLPPLAVTLSCATPGTTLYYTTDGTEPSPTNGQVFTDPLAIQSSTELRAVAVRPGFENSSSARSWYRQPVIRYVAANLTLPVNGWTPLDLDQDGNIDVMIFAGVDGAMVIDGAAVGNADQFSVSRLDPDTAIGPYSSFVWTFCDWFGCSFPYVYNEFFAPDEWAPGGTGIMGVIFAIDGQSHSGWIRIRIAGDAQPAAVIDWAYEMQPERPIFAGDSGPVACPPRFAIQPADRELVEGASFSLRTLAVGPGVQYEWFRNGESLASDTRY